MIENDHDIDDELEEAEELDALFRWIDAEITASERRIDYLEVILRQTPHDTTE